MLDSSGIGDLHGAAIPCRIQNSATEGRIVSLWIFKEVYAFVAVALESGKFSRGNDPVTVFGDTVTVKIHLHSSCVVAPGGAISRITHVD